LIQVVQQGLLDTIQDAGRYGYQHLGINPGGAMDRAALYVANSLVGNASKDAAIELHFPASAFLFEEDALIALSGADFGAMVNEQPVAVNQPVLISKHAVLRFTKPVSGARCYLAVRGGLQLTPWLGSYSTHLKAGAGGFKGRALQKGDRIAFSQHIIFRQDKQATPLPWKADVSDLYAAGSSIRFIPGHEWTLLEDESLLNGDFLLTEQCDRMGFRLRGPVIKTHDRKERLSAGVSRGTIQLLPGGQLIILMADHQTTGGYARLGHVITADMPTLSQHAPHQQLHFRMVDEKTAESLLLQQEQRLQILQNACKLRLEEWQQNHQLTNI
jgi:antagonist of KipI